MKKWLSYAGSSNWLRVVGVATIVLLACYLMIQQSTRLSANDAPLSEAQTIKHELESGMSAKDAVPPVKTDLRTDSTIFAIVTDSSYKVVASSATLDGGLSLPPSGAFTTTNAKGSDWFTWQPEVGVRSAVEMLKYTYKNQSGVIITGQSLAQPEHRIDIFGWITLAAWLGVVLWATFIPIPVRK